MGRIGLVERRIVDAFGIGTGRQGLPDGPRPRRLLTELAANGVGDRAGDDVRVDADALTERGHLNDGHPPTSDDRGTVGG
jgi:hypothetical protein